LIASTKYPQIFTIRNSIAVQFHPEVTETLFKDWYDSDISRKELLDYDVSSTLNYLTTNTEQFKFEINSIYKKWKNI
ncbi:hypothetical protein N9T89_01020, partial [Candidatus Actinomarina]|nr:hypothetical protein [Candidatus Actinomarina sp.]